MGSLCHHTGTVLRPTWFLCSKINRTRASETRPLKVPWWFPVDVTHPIGGKWCFLLTERKDDKIAHPFKFAVYGLLRLFFLTFNLKAYRASLLILCP